MVTPTMGRELPQAVNTQGQAQHDSTQLQMVLDTIRVPRRVRVGRGSVPAPEHLVADKGCPHHSYPTCRRLLRGRGHSSYDTSHRTLVTRASYDTAHVSARRRRAASTGRKPGFDKEVYRRQERSGKMYQQAQASTSPVMETAAAVLSKTTEPIQILWLVRLVALSSHSSRHHRILTSSAIQQTLPSMAAAGARGLHRRCFGFAPDQRRGWRW